MRNRCWILSIAISALAGTAAKQACADPREKQQSLQKLAREIVQSGRVDPQQQQDYEQDNGGSWDWRIRNSPSGASFYVPQTQQRSDGLWYDLGWCKIDDLYFEFDQPLGTESGTIEPKPPAANSAATAPTPAVPSTPMSAGTAAPNATNSAASNSSSATTASADAAPPVADDEPATPDVFDYPLKAQLLVELVREYGSRPLRRQGARPLKLDDATLRQIEQIAQEEIKAIEAAQQKNRRSTSNEDAGAVDFDEVSNLLQDYDARITRLVMAQLDAQTDKRGQVLRKNREAGAGGGSEPVQVSFQFPAGMPEPNRVLVMCGGNFDYLKSTWNTAPEANLDDHRWKSVHWEKAENKLVGDIPPGRQAIVAVWDENGKTKFARAHKYPDVFKGNEEVVFDAIQPVAGRN